MTNADLKSFLQQRYSTANRQTLLDYLFGNSKDLFTQPRILAQDADTINLAQQIGSVKLADGRSLGLFDVSVTEAVQIARNRKGLRDLAAKYIDQNIIHGALVFVHGPNQIDYRLTFIARYSAFNLETLELERNETAPKRFSFVLGPNEPCTTAARRLMELVGKPVIDLKALTDTFAVEPLNREFFRQFKDVHFKKIWHYLAEHHWPDFLGDVPMPTGTAPADIKEKDRLAKPVRDFAKKMLGRIVFLHFLQKKGWMGCPLPSLYEGEGLGVRSSGWSGGNIRFVQTLFERFRQPDRFYSRCLTKLFFDTLNDPNRPGFRFEAAGIEPCRVPYLNGGLFDRDTRPDGQLLTEAIDLPADYFASLLQFFDQYNFTIDENSPGDYEVGIDPEMLGHIFENLLEENREKGAFYTPKEIVQYMCQESLIQHLAHRLTAELGEAMRPALLEALDTLIRQGSRGDEQNRHNLITIHAPRIEELLDDLKICDPAIGSGAFPVGMLGEIFAAKMTLDLTLNRAEVKKRIIRETIYGVDMEPGAVDIARLRFWLSLVVDEDEPQPLPNLDYKIMQGDSLLESFEGVIPLRVTAGETNHDPTRGVLRDGQLKLDGTLKDAQLGLGFAFAAPKASMTDGRKAKLRRLIQAYFKAGTKDEKQDLRNQINAEINKHIDECIQAEQAKWTDKKNEILGQLFMARQAQKNAKTPAKQREYEKAIARKETELERFQNLLTDEQAREARLARSKQNGEKGYFLWHLFFPEVFEKGGFDICIANPPYLQLSRIPTEAAQYGREGYSTFEKTGDIYGLFYEQGVRLLRPGGILTYITSNSWLQTQYGKPLRQLFVEQTDPLTLLNFADTRLFETAVVETNILITRRDKCTYQLQAATVGADFDKERDTLPAYIAQHAFRLTDLPAEGWSVGDEQANTLKKKIEGNGKKLGEWEVEINRGILTGYNQAFIIDGKTRKRLTEEDVNNHNVIKPSLRGRDLTRYFYNNSDSWMIVSHNGLREENLLRVDIPKDYPSLYSFFKSNEFQPAIQNRYDKGNHWTNLRNCAYLKDFDKPKIIWGELADKAKFTYDDAGTYFNDTIFMMIGDSLKYLLAVLNSKAAQWYFEQITTTSGMGTNRWKKYKIEQLPVPEPDAQTERQLEQLVDTVLALKKTQSMSADTLAYEAQIDALVFRAYGLTETEVLYVLDQFPTVGSREREQIRNNFRNLERGNFSLLV
ncbi:MAG: hypothetical protein EAZ91_19100 [Cytophagales bacterium]|nr:MAG: hypothetical protein EAZ91_19100 [Cytophagales bacterium]